VSSVQSRASTVTRRHSGAEQDWIRHAAFRAAIDATMRWDPQSYRYDARIWPPSSFLEPMLAPTLLPARRQSLPGLATTLRQSGEDLRALDPVLRRAIESDAPPWRELDAGERGRWWHELAAAVTTHRVRQVLHEGFADVRTAHDLRGYAVMLGTAMGGG
jgi:hypothetical protein